MDDTLPVSIDSSSTVMGPVLDWLEKGKPWTQGGLKSNETTKYLNISAQKPTLANALQHTEIVHKFVRNLPAVSKFIFFGVDFQVDF